MPLIELSSPTVGLQDVGGSLLGELVAIRAHPQHLRLAGKLMLRTDSWI
jgi:hypothetical protein